MRIASTKQQKLDEIKAKILADDPVPDLRTGATQLVFGDGSADAELLFVGEAPGKNEDIQGLPFVGAAGKFLNEMLEGIGLKREDVYITNIVKYRPPANRDPFPDEKAAFLPYLKQQIAVIGPKLVVTLGRHSMEIFLPGAAISQIHGQPKRISVQKSASEEVETQPAITSWVILPMFHPAAALYNGGMRQTLIEDFGRIPAVLKQVGQLKDVPPSAPPVKTNDAQSLTSELTVKEPSQLGLQF